MRRLLAFGAAALTAAAAVPLIAQAQSPAPAPVYQDPVPVPAYQQPAYDPGGYADEYEDDRFGYEPAHGAPLLDPREIGAMAAAMDRLLGAVMDLPIGGIAAAVDPMGRSDIPPGATVRDMAERDDPYAEERLRSGIQGSVQGVNAMAQGLARVMPVLERSIADVERSMDQAMEPYAE